MKKLLFFALVAALILAGCKTTAPQSNIPDIHTTRISVDWNGVYYGEVPSASGTGIAVRIELTIDETYELQYYYIERPETVFTAGGNFKWHDDGATITLEGLEEYPKYYWVSAGYMLQLDMKGKRITGPNADKYILRKIQ